MEYVAFSENEQLYSYEVFRGVIEGNACEAFVAEIWGDLLAPWTLADRLRGVGIELLQDGTGYSSDTDDSDSASSDDSRHGFDAKTEDIVDDALPGFTRLEDWRTAVKVIAYEMDSESWQADRYGSLTRINEMINSVINAQQYIPKWLEEEEPWLLRRLNLFFRKLRVFLDCAKTKVSTVDT